MYSKNVFFESIIKFKYFNMMMIADLSKVEKPFEVLANELAETGLSMGVQVKCQREEIFDKMHRI